MLWTTRRKWLVALLAFALAGRAVAMQVVINALEKGAPGGPYTAFDPCMGQMALIGEEIRLVLDITNNNGQLSYCCVTNGNITAIPGCITGHLPQVPCCPGRLPTDIFGWYFIYPDLPYLGNPFFPDNPNGPLEFVSADDLPFAMAENEMATVEWKFLVANEGDFNLNAWATRQTDPADYMDTCTSFITSYVFTEGTQDQNLYLQGANPGADLPPGLISCDLVTKSPLVASSVAYVVGTGGTSRPPGIAYIEDVVRVDMTVTNTGIVDLTAVDGKVCAVPNFNAWSQLCATGWEVAGACANGTRPGTPALPYLITKDTGADPHVTFSWTFTVNGEYCTQGMPGGGSVFFDSVVLGKWAESATIVVGPAPLVFTVTVWVDPDAGGALPYVPLGSNPLDLDQAAYLYYMADETVQIRLTIANPTAQSFDLHPKIKMADDLGGTVYELIGYTQTASSVGPSSSQSFTWTYQRNLSYLGTCKWYEYNLTFEMWDRGILAAKRVRLRQHPFIASPSCDCTSCGITLNVPAAGYWWTEWNAVVNARNADSRAVTIGAPAGVTLYIYDMGPEAEMVRGPDPADDLPQTWSAGETRSFTWTFTSTGLGTNPDQVCFEAGMVWPISIYSPACVVAGSEQYPRCSGVDKVPPNSDVRACALTMKEPEVVVARFEYMGPGTAVARDQLLPIEMLLVNKGAEVVTIYDLCSVASGVPIQDVGGSAPWGPVINGTYYPTPMVPFVMNPGDSVTIYWDAVASNCGTSVPFGCRTPTVGSPMVSGSVLGIPSIALTQMTSNTVDVRIPASLDWQDPPLLTTDKPEYSGGQKIYVTLTVTNQGQNDMVSFSQTLNTLMEPAGCATLVSVTPAVTPTTLTGVGGTCPNSPYYGQTEKFVYEFDAVTFGRICFTASLTGTDSVSGISMTRLTNNVCVRIAKPAVLEIDSWSTPLVTMSRACPTCPLVSDCLTKGENCISVVLKAMNKGEISLVNAQPVADVQVKPCPTDLTECPGSQETTGTADQGGYSLEVGTTVTIYEASNQMYTWTFTPTGLGCVRFFVQMYAKDAATGVDWTEVGYTGCTDIVDRLPVQVSLKGVPTTVIPGQEFEVTIEIYNPGTTGAVLQGGEPALVFVDPATGAALTEKFDVVLPTPVSVKSGERITITAKVRALPGAPVGMVEIRIPQSTMYAAKDAETGFRISVVGVGSGLLVEVVPAETAVKPPVPNPFRPWRDLKTELTYSLAVGGRVQLKVYSLSGELVKTLVDEDRPLGLWTVEWNGRNSRNQVCASGIYLLRFEGPTREGRRYSEVRKLAIIK